jgi:hypothetical protein
MTLSCYGYFDPDENRTKCVAKKSEHEYCKKYMPCNNGRPCGHYRSDLGGGCDNASIQFDAWKAALKLS